MSRTTPWLAGLALWAAVTALAIGQDTPAADVILGGKQVSIALSAARNYQPAGLRFSLDGAAVSVAVDEVEFLPAPPIAPATCRVVRAGESAETSADLVGAGRRALLSRALPSEGRAEFELTAAGGDAGEIILRISGADRLAAADGEAYALRRLDAGQAAIDAAGASVAVQSRRDQLGLIVHVAAGAAGKLHIVPRDGGAEIRIPWRQERGAAGAALRLTVQPFRGDAIIAMEDAGGASAPPTTAVALGAGGAGLLDPARGDDQPGPTPWEFFTGTKRAFPPLLADPREASVRVGVGYGRHAQKFLDVGIGGDLVLAERRFADQSHFTLSARGLITGRLDTCESNFPLLNSDFYGGVAGGYRFGNDAVEAYLYHTSSHLGDETLEAGRRQRIDYSREAIRVLWSHWFGPLRVYGGPTYNMRGFPDDISNKTIFQAGAEYRFWAWDTPAYVATDLQSKEENGWDVNFTLQAGVELGDPKKVRNRARLFAEFFNGFSNMGQYWDERETSILLGLGYNF